MNWRCFCGLSFIAAMLTPPALAQNATATARPAFEVVSIRPSKPGTRAAGGLSITPDGYTVTGQSLFTTIMMAYFPQPISTNGFSYLSFAAYWTKERLSGAPGWINDPYDITAKVADADLAAWQKQGATLDKKPMLRAMLQSLLEERCHLAAHMAPGPTISGWSLTLGKRDPRLTESKTGETLPVGMRLDGGGVSVPYQPGDKPRLTIYGGTIGDLAQMLATYAAAPVQDHTGLAGHYDLVVDWIPYPDSKVPVAYKERDDPDPLARWDIDAIGLRYSPVKIPADTLVIDHIEKPSEN